MENFAELPSKAAGRRRKSAADVHSLLSRPKPQSSTPLQSITEDGPAFRTPLSATPDANVQTTKTAEVAKKARRRSSTAGAHVEIAERKAQPQTRSFMEVKRSEEAHILKAQRLEEALALVQAELTSAKVEALQATEEVSALKARLSESEEERELLSSRYADSAHELAAGRSELKEIRQKLQTAVEECASAKSEAATSAAAAREASDRNMALKEALQRRVMQPGLAEEELREIQKQVHEQDEFASSLSYLHEQVERTRQEIKARMEKAADKASALGLGTVVDGLSGSGSRSMSPPLEVEKSVKHEAETPIDRVVEEGDGSTMTSQSSQLSEQLSDLVAVSEEGLTVTLQTDISSEHSREHVALPVVPEAADALVAVESPTQLASPGGKAAGEAGCTEDLIRRSKAKGLEFPHEQLESILTEPSINSED